MEKVNFYVEVLAKADIASVAVMDGTKLLMGKRRDNGRWTLPGGHFDPGEGKYEAAARELFEEAGIKVSTKKLKHIGSEKITTFAGKKNTIHAFTVDGNGAKPTTKNDPDDEVEKWQWVESKHGLPRQIKENLHSPKNVVLQKLGLMKANQRAEVVSYYLNKDCFKSDSKKDLIAEHKRLVGVLRSPSRKDDKKEAKIQAKELKEYQGKSFYLNSDLFKARPHKYLRKYQHGGKWIYVYHEGDAHGRQIPEEAVHHLRALAEEHGDHHARGLLDTMEEHNPEKLKLLRELADEGHQDAHEHLKRLGIDRHKEKLEEQVIPAQVKKKDQIDEEHSPTAKRSHEDAIGRAVDTMFNHLRSHTSSPFYTNLVRDGITKQSIMDAVMTKNTTREMLKELHNQLLKVDRAHKGMQSQNADARDAGGYGNSIYKKAVKNLEQMNNNETGKTLLPEGYGEVHSRGQEPHGVKEHEERVERKRREAREKEARERREREERERRELAEVHGSMAHGLNRFMITPLPIDKIREIHRVFTDMFGKNMRAEDWPYDFSEQGYNVKIRNVRTGSQGVDFDFEVTDRDGNQVTRDWRRSWSSRNGAPSIYNAYLAVNSSARGSDQPIGLLINRAQQKLMKEHAPSRGTIRVTAALDVGGYNWANQGFEFDSSDEAASKRRSFKEFARAHGVTLTDEELSYFKQPCHFAAFHNGKLYEQRLSSPIKVSTKQLERGEIAPGVPLTDQERREKKTSRMFVHLGKKFLLGSSFHGVIRASNMNEDNEAFRFAQHYDQLKLKAWQKLSEGYKKAVKRAGGETDSPQIVVGSNQSYTPSRSLASSSSSSRRQVRRPTRFRRWSSAQMTQWFDQNSSHMSLTARRATRQIIRERIAQEQGGG